MIKVDKLYSEAITPDVGLGGQVHLAKAGFTPLEKAADFSRRLSSDKSDGGLKLLSAQTVRERSSLTGFTLIELVAVIVIIGIVAAIAIPAHTNTRERTLDKEAISGLKLIQVANKQHFARMGQFWPVGAVVNNVTQINGNLSLDLSGAHWIYSVSCAANGTYYTAIASRQTRDWTLPSSLSVPTCAPAASCYN